MFASLIATALILAQAPGTTVIEDWSQTGRWTKSGSFTRAFILDTAKTPWLKANSAKVLNSGDGPGSAWIETIIPHGAHFLIVEIASAYEGRSSLTVQVRDDTGQWVEDQAINATKTSKLASFDIPIEGGHPIRIFLKTDVGMLVGSILASENRSTELGDLSPISRHGGTTLDPVVQADVQKRMEELKNRRSIPGVWCAVYDAKKGGVVADYASGDSSLEQERKATTDTLISYGPVSKPITGLLTAVVSGKGVLRMDDSIGISLPEMRVFAYAHQELLMATVGQLLSNTAGISSGPYAEDMIKEKDPSPSRLAFAQHILVASPVGKPGAQTLYASGCEIVGVILESRTSESLERLLSEEIFRPLGLASCRLGEPNATDPKADTPWGYSNQKMQAVANGAPEMPPFVRFLTGKSMYGTAADLAQLFGVFCEGAKKGFGGIPKAAFQLAMGSPEGLGQPGTFTYGNLKVGSRKGLYTFSGWSSRTCLAMYLDVNSGKCAVVAGNLLGVDGMVPDMEKICDDLVK